MIRARVWWCAGAWHATVTGADGCIIATRPFPTHEEAVTWADTETRRPLEAP